MKIIGNYCITCGFQEKYEKKIRNPMRYTNNNYYMAKH